MKKARSVKCKFPILKAGCNGQSEKYCSLESNVCLNALDTRVVLADGRTEAPLKFRLFRQNFFDWPKGDRTCLCDDCFQIKTRNVSKYGKG